MTKEPEFIAEDGTVRKQHYGSGKQPWDIIVKLGWGPVFAAGNALKYVKRYMHKNGADDLEKGKWYSARLTEMAQANLNIGQANFPAITAWKQLIGQLNEEEVKLLDLHDKI